MKTIIVKDLMVPLEEYATVSMEATLYEAVLALEKAQLGLAPSRHKNRAILVLDRDNNVLGKITLKNILLALEPNYGKLEGTEVLSSLGYSPDLIKSIFDDHAFWCEPLQFICKRAFEIKVKDFVHAPLEGEYVDENTTLGKAIHQLIVYPYHSLLVTCSDAVVGILRLSDAFEKICAVIKTCER